MRPQGRGRLEGGTFSRSEDRRAEDVRDGLGCWGEPNELDDEAVRIGGEVKGGDRIG